MKPTNTNTSVTTTGGGFSDPSLHVRDLDLSVSEGQLYDLGVILIATSTTIKMTPINSNPLRIMRSRRDTRIQKSGQANIFIKNLDSLMKGIV